MNQPKADLAEPDLAHTAPAAKGLAPRSRAAHRDRQIDALTALEQARELAPGPERAEALKRAGLLRHAAELPGSFFPKQGRPRKR